MCARSKDMSGKYFRNLVTNLTIKEEKNKTISDGGIIVDFWFIKVHTSN